MARIIFRIAVLGSLSLILAGCSGPKAAEPLWEHVKITDLAPSGGIEQPRLLETANFNVYIFEIPAANIAVLDNIRRLLYTKPLQFNDYNAFCGNSFSAGFGQMQSWDAIAELLRAGEGRKTETVSILIAEAQANDLTIVGLDKEQTVFYVSSGGPMEEMTIGPGSIVLRIEAEQIPGERGICKVAAVPVFLPAAPSLIPELAAREKSQEFVFESAGFGLKMAPGDFVLLSPEKYIDRQITLGSLFFSIPGRLPMVRAYLLVCTRINY
jgi:hypothetical protein